ncbi:protrudin isoform X2 [Esox lucius]|uniref:Protrudin n=1 Tax=Esox lucius TaxID=8010 RepID=A0AAY5K6L2_ESOLU|nr:protrudin isoform X2 [Esox lucius]
MQPVTGCQDPCQSGSGERGGDTQVSIPPKDTPGSPAGSHSELGSSSPRAAVTFDLFNMVVSYRRMALFLEPLTDALELARYLLGWRMPLFSLLVCLILNILFLTLSEVGWFSVCVVGVSAPAALGYLQDRCGGGASEVEQQKRWRHTVQRRDLQNFHLTRQDAMMEVKHLLKQLDDLLSQACLSAESVYKVLYWDSHSTSSRFYGGMLTVLILLHYVPVGWLLAGLTSTLFLWNRHFCRVVLDLREVFQSSRIPSSEGEGDHTEPEHGCLDRTPTPTSLEDLSPGSVEEAEEAEPDDEFKDAIEESTQEPPVSPQVRSLSGWLPALLRRQVECRLRAALKEDDDVPLGTPDFDAVSITSDNGLLSRNEPIRSKVSKLTEKLRKRYPTNNTGNCSSCASVFSVVKRRRSCSNCGNSFCSRCCSYKVLKSCMGATAPEAQRETVFVCAACNTALSK